VAIVPSAFSMVIQSRGFGLATTIITNAFFRSTIVSIGTGYGIPLAEVAGHLGVSMSAISKAITRGMKE
jgi:hypothetical protein